MKLLKVLYDYDLCETKLNLLPKILNIFKNPLLINEPKLELICIEFIKEYWKLLNSKFF